MLACPLAAQLPACSAPVRFASRHVVLPENQRMSWATRVGTASFSYRFGSSAEDGKRRANEQ